MPSEPPKVGLLIKLKAGRPASNGGNQLRARVWTAGRLLILAGALVITFAAFFLASLQVASRARAVAVPDLGGLAVAEASRRLADVGLVIRVDPIRRADLEVPADHVLTQEPEPGDVLRRGRPVRVRVSDGHRAPAVPAVVGQQELSADMALRGEGIEIATRSEIRSLAYGAGTVVAQDPPPGTASPTATLLVNRGEAAPTFVMPDLIGTVGARAAEALRRQNLRATITTEVAYPGLPSGIVVVQSPRAGFQIAVSDAITLTVTR